MDKDSHFAFLLTIDTQIKQFHNSNLHNVSERRKK